MTTSNKIEECEYVMDRIDWYIDSMYAILQAIHMIWDRSMIPDIALAWDYTTSACSGYLNVQSPEVVSMVAKALGYNK